MANRCDTTISRVKRFIKVSWNVLHRVEIVIVAFYYIGLDIHVIVGIIEHLRA